MTSSLIGPLPLGLPHAEPAEATQVQPVNVTPAGGVSTMPAPATALGPRLDATIVYVVLVPGVTLATPSVLVIRRSATPVAASVAEAGSGLVTPCADVNNPAASGLIRLPLAFATTLSWMRHVALAAIEPPLSVTVPAPATAVNAPPHVFDEAGGVAITMPAGSVSTSPVVVSAMALALLLRTLIVSCDVPPTITVAGLNDLLSVTLVATRVIVALAAAGLTKP